MKWLIPKLKYVYGLERTILTSLAICFLYEAYKPGMIFFPIRRLMEKALSFLPEKVNLYIRNPLFDCVVCMSSVYGILFTVNIITLSFQYLLFLFQIGGLNFLLSLFIRFFHDTAEKDLVVHEKIERKEEDKVDVPKTPPLFKGTELITIPAKHYKEKIKKIIKKTKK